MKTWMKALLAVVLFVAFFPVRLVSECSYGPPGALDFVGYCSDTGVSLIGIEIPGAVMGAGGGLLLVVVLLAPFAYAGYRMDRRSRARSER